VTFANATDYVIFISGIISDIHVQTFSGLVGDQGKGRMKCTPALVTVKDDLQSLQENFHESSASAVSASESDCHQCLRPEKCARSVAAFSGRFPGVAEICI
jgi:hypothetical protein